MDDLELLMMAAKAIGRKVKRIDGDSRTLCGIFFEDHDPDDYSWNPLTDDGDALRLAAKCKIDIHHGGQYIETLFGRNRASIAVVAEYFRREEHRLEAARRAIVRAAAEIAKGKTNG